MLEKSWARNLNHEISDKKFQRTWYLVREIFEWRWNLGKEISNMKSRARNFKYEISDKKFQTWNVRQEIEDISNQETRNLVSKEAYKKKL